MVAVTLLSLHAIYAFLLLVLIDVFLKKYVQQQYMDQSCQLLLMMIMDSRSRYTYHRRFTYLKYHLRRGSGLRNLYETPDKFVFLVEDFCSKKIRL